MRFRTLIALFATAGFVLACEQQAADETGEMTDPTVDVAAETEAIHALADRYEQAVGAADVETLGTLWTDDATWTTHDGNQLVGNQAIRDQYTQDFAAMSTPTMEINPAETVVASSGDVAWESGTYTIRGTLTDGTAVEQTHRYLVTFEKADGEWKLAQGMDTAPQGAAGETAPAEGAEAPTGP